MFQGWAFYESFTESFLFNLCPSLRNNKFHNYFSFVLSDATTKMIRLHGSAAHGASTFSLLCSHPSSFSLLLFSPCSGLFTTSPGTVLKTKANCSTSIRLWWLLATSHCQDSVSLFWNLFSNNINWNWDFQPCFFTASAAAAHI